MRLGLPVSNFVCEKGSTTHKHAMNYQKISPTERSIGWNEIGHFLPGQYILICSVTYRMALLKNHGLELSAHTSYVDSILICQSLPYVKTFYYLDANFYHYYVNRKDQSVSEQVIIGRTDQQLHITRLMVEGYDPYKISQKRPRHYMILYLEIMITICSILTIESEPPENLKKEEEIWRYLKR